MTETTGAVAIQVNVIRDVSAVEENMKALVPPSNEAAKFINERHAYAVTMNK